MGNQIGFVDDTTQLAHYEMVQAIADFADAQGWTILRHDTGGVDHELILQAPGLSGTEEIFCGFRTYHSVGADYYNLLAGVFTGYVAGNSFDTQPGALFSGIPAHNQHIDYWLTINGQRLVLAMKLGTPVYESCYLGKFLPYGTPSQYPYPVCCGGMLTGAAATRFSDTSHSMPYKGDRANMQIRLVSGTWTDPFCWPWGNTYLMASGSNPYQIRPTETTYPLNRIVLHNNSSNVYGELDGVFQITGFDNVVENTLDVDGDDYVVIQDVFRTGFLDYYAIRLDPNPP